MNKTLNASTAYNGVELTDDLLDTMAQEYEHSSWEGHEGDPHVGRPRFGEEKLVPVTIKIAPSKLAAIDQLAADHDETRSGTMRRIIDSGLAAAS